MSDEGVDPPFPGAWQNISARHRLAVIRRHVAKQLEAYEGAARFIRATYCGTLRPDGTRVSWVATEEECWKLVCEDARTMSSHPVQEAECP